MDKDIFIAQFHFFIPLQRIGKKYHERFLSGPQFIEPSFAVKRHETDCHFIKLTNKDFYFRTKSKGKYYCNIELETYLLRHRITGDKTTEIYYLVVAAEIDKLFKENVLVTDYESIHTNDLSVNICDIDDLAYLKRAFYGDNENDALISSLDEPHIIHKEWIKQLVADIENDKERELDFGYSLVDICSAHIYDKPDTVQQLDELFDKAFYSEECANPQLLDTAKSVRLALALLNGNENYKNISDIQISKFAGHCFSNNKYERMYANKNGIVSIRTRHAFETTDDTVRHASIVKELYNVINIYEICAAIYAIMKIKEIKKKLRDNKLKNTRNVLAQMADYLSMEMTHVADTDHKLTFIYKRMGIVKEFERLKTIGELRSDAQNLKLSHRLNFTMMVFTVFTFCLMVFQVLSDFPNSSSNNDTHCCNHQGFVGNCSGSQPADGAQLVTFNFDINDIVILLKVILCIVIFVIFCYCVLTVIRKLLDKNK